MLLTEPFWIETGHTGRLGIMPRPRGGEWLEDEIAGWKAGRVDAVLCLLQPNEIAELDLAAEERLCRDFGIVYLSFAIPDRAVPDDAVKFKQLALDLRDRLRKRQSVAIHCRAGIGRSALAAACTMIVIGFKADPAISLIARARGLLVPDTTLQRDWIAAFETNDMCSPEWKTKA
jgi:protein-tyrosine phosphatase